MPALKISFLDEIVEDLCKPDQNSRYFENFKYEVSMPSNEKLRSIMELLLSVLFPGFFGEPDVKPTTLRYYLGATIDKIFPDLREQIKRGFCFQCQQQKGEHCLDCEVKAEEIAQSFIRSLKKIRTMLNEDVNAAFKGDPAAESHAETIFCYPSIRAVAYYRIAHQLHTLQVPLIPRLITEMAHSDTGIDIHPAAKIQEGFFIDHGTGTVIGATCEIGKNVQIYQGVTLGAKSFALDSDGNPIKGVPRHPIVEDDVTIYAGATILGRITLGKGSIIGGNVWLTHNIEPYTRVLQGKVNKRILRGKNPGDVDDE